MILSSIKNREEWLKIISLLPLKYQDIYYHPDYISLNCLNKKNSEGYLFFNIENSKLWVNTFIKIMVPDLVNNSSTTYFDIETAYGYGGPISNTKDLKFIQNSNLKFFDWVKSNNIICEFVRFHPLINSTDFTDNNIKIIENRITCSLDVNLVDLNLSPFKSKVKNMIRKATQFTNAIISKEKSDYNTFVKLYINLMIEKNAEKETFFSSKYFDKLYELIKSSGFMSVIKNKKSEILAIGIFLNGKKSCHYHLAASVKSRYSGLNNYLIYNAAMHAKKLNLDVLHLGGGNLNVKEDMLFKFKKSMSSDEHKFFIGKRINNKDMYQKLKNAWRKKYPILYDKYSSRLLCYHVNTEIVDTEI